MQVRTYLNTTEVGDRLGLSVKTLANWRSAGIGPAYLKVGGRVLYPEDLLTEWLTERIVEADQPAGAAA